MFDTPPLLSLFDGGEIRTADGRIDMVIDTESRVFILEFKLDDTAAKPSTRVYDFKVEMLVDDKTKVSRLVLANGFNVPAKGSFHRGRDCLNRVRSGRFCPLRRV